MEGAAPLPFKRISVNCSAIPEQPAMGETNVMTFSLYDATVANYLQILGSTEALMAKSLVQFKEKGIDPATIVETRLSDDMLPWRFQVVSAAHPLGRGADGQVSRCFPGEGPRPRDHRRDQTLRRYAAIALSGRLGRSSFARCNGGCARGRVRATHCAARPRL